MWLDLMHDFLQSVGGFIGLKIAEFFYDRWIRKTPKKSHYSLLAWSAAS
jgi:hypothetical protein